MTSRFCSSHLGCGPIQICVNGDVSFGNSCLHLQGDDVSVLVALEHLEACFT